MPKTNHDADVAFVKALTELLRENDLSELEVTREYGECDTLNVRIARKKEMVLAATTVTAPPASAAPLARATASTQQAPEDPTQHAGAVTSPMVGTAYLQPEPGTPAFVSVGDSVTEGQTLCIVEAMKTMNQIPAPRAGTVRRILIEDGAPVEFGAPLMIVD